MESVIFALLRIAELYLFLRLVLVLSAAYLTANEVAVRQVPIGHRGQAAAGVRQTSSRAARQGAAHLPGQRYGQGARRSPAGTGATRSPHGASPQSSGPPNISNIPNILNIF